MHGRYRLFDLGPVFLERYREIFTELYAEDRALTLRRGFWGFVLGLLSTVAFYGAYAWIALETIAKRITLGDMTFSAPEMRIGHEPAFVQIDVTTGGLAAEVVRTIGIATAADLEAALA